MPKINVVGNQQDFQKIVKNEKPKRSNFLLTINTNKSIAIDAADLQTKVAAFDKSINEILANINQYLKIPEGDDWNDENKFRDVDIQYTIEVGHKQRRLHIHILMKFTHFSKIQLDYEKIKSKICNDIGLSNVYMLNKLIRNNGSENILDYLGKYV
jgi:hypothetical protein